MSYAQGQLPGYTIGLFLALALVYGFCSFLLPALPKNEKLKNFTEEHSEIFFLWLLLIPLAMLALLLIFENVGGDYSQGNTADTASSYPIYPNYPAVMFGFLLIALGIGLFAVAKKPWLNRPTMKETVKKVQVQEEHEQLREELEAVRLNPQSYVAWTNLGYKQHQLDKNEDALSSANQALSLNKNSAYAWIVRGAALSEMDGQEDKALEALERALIIEPNNVNALYYKGVVYSYQKNDSAAHAIFDRVLALNPRHKEALATKGSAYLATEDYNEALEVARELIRYYPDEAVGWRIQGMAYSFQGEEKGLALEKTYDLLNKALASFNRAIEIEPRYSFNYLLKAEPFIVMGDNGRALEALNQGLNINPNDPQLREAKAEIVRRRTKKVASRVAGTAGRLALGVGLGLVEGHAHVAKSIWDDRRKS